MFGVLEEVEEEIVLRTDVDRCVDTRSLRRPEFEESVKQALFQDLACDRKESLRTIPKMRGKRVLCIAVEHEHESAGSICGDSRIIAIGNLRTLIAAQISNYNSKFVTIPPITTA